MKLTVKLTGKLSIIVTTYQRPRALDKVLASLAMQTIPFHELVVADDGSGPETADLIQQWQARCPVPLRHVWQEDQGFRAAAARNRAVAASEGDYLVFLDGDCLVFPDFVARHLALAESGYLVIGSRLLLSREMTKQVEAGSILPLNWGWRDWWRVRQAKQVNRIFPLLRLPGQSWRRLRPWRWQGVRTFNLGVWRRDFERANGFDETFQGWGHEDADLAVRLQHTGIRRKDGQFAVPVLHLWHPENDRRQEVENQRRLRQRLDDRAGIRAELGLDRYRNGG